METLTDVTAASAQKGSTEADSKDNALYPEEEITEGNWNTPVVEVVDVKVTTGEEDESIFWSKRAKLFRWKSGEWKQRGVGEAKLLEHVKSGRIRFLLRQEKTLKIVANHYVLQTEVYCKLTPNSGSEKIWVWAVMDYAEDTVQNEQFALKLRTVEDATAFKKKFEEAAKINSKLITAAKKTSDHDRKGDESESSVSKEKTDAKDEKETEVSVSEKS
ncbi:putative ran binding family protein 1 [Cardiosporidium cionae]|uniref:Ran binding family protein 1 n=1 Tax=Cardiosporidium cionae TaxID=476202 RepID=A0ABQ7J8W8_9APIC|nr:putative ran binding family protein 1 [Cardiosporidium cionae]|eukprot:KAF8820411.1 putative ran binding family protein 1 [Cardiosporidium cionae]